MSRSAQDVLEFDKLRELLRLRTTCAPGKRAIEALAFSHDRAALDAVFAAIREAREWLRGGGDLGFGGLLDPEGWLAKLQVPARAGARRILQAASLMETAGWVRQEFREQAVKFPLLTARAGALADFRDALAAIRRCILPNKDISDDASPALRRIRASILQTRDSIQKTLRQILRDRTTGGEDYVTLRNDRFVIPVRSENRRSVQGVVHGSSGTGQTVFLEPFETVEVNNQLVQLSQDEATEILRILRELTERLQAICGPLAATAETIAELDRFSRAICPRFRRHIARIFRNWRLAFAGCAPSRTRRQTEAPRPGRRPLTLNSAARKKSWSSAAQTPAANRGVEDHWTSHPGTMWNTGCGAAAVLPLFDHVLVDIGDEQSITADLPHFSTYAQSEIHARIGDTAIARARRRNGHRHRARRAPLWPSPARRICAKNCIVLATTHHDRLKTYASTTPGVVNAAVEFDDVNLRPTYRLMVGVPGGSSGIAIAQRLGLAHGIIERARSLLTPESREAADLIAYLHRSRDELDRMQSQMSAERHALEEERKKLRTEWVDRQQKRIKELEAQFAEMQKRFDDNMARVIEAVKERELRSSLEKTARRKGQEVRSEAREELNAAVVQAIANSQADLGATASSPEAVRAESLQPGTRIRVRGFTKPVIFRRLDGSSAEIEAGPLRMKVAIDEIVAIEGSPVASRSGASALKE
jgi:DNA mismatch repair protein MutS2